jgi:hypothetical protein
MGLFLGRLDAGGVGLSIPGIDNGSYGSGLAFTIASPFALRVPDG